MIKVVHYINQFFAQIGGEEMAHVKPEVREGIVGPGVAFNAAFKGEAEIVATVICGDTYYNENLESAKKEILDMIKQYNPDVVRAFKVLKNYDKNGANYIAAYGNKKNEVANKVEGKKEILDMIKQYNPDVFIAGPAFNAGRYGVACGDIATAVQNEFNIGYIAVKNAIEVNDGEKAEKLKLIKSTVIESDDMYSPKNERILFQFVR